MACENETTLLKEISCSIPKKSNGRTFHLKFLLLFCAALIAGIVYCQFPLGFVLDEYYISSVRQRFTQVIAAVEKFSFPEIPGSFFRFIKSLMVGLFAVYYSWEIIYFDSIAPGIQPPSPLSPSRIRAVSKRSFDLNHILAIINGMFFGVLIFCWT